MGLGCNTPELIVMKGRLTMTEIRILLRAMFSAGVLAVLVLACAGMAAGAIWVVDDCGGAEYT